MNIMKIVFLDIVTTISLKVIKYYRIGAFTTPVLIITPLLSKFEYNATFTSKSTYFGPSLRKIELKFEYNVT